LRSDGAVLGEDNDILPDLVSTVYAIDSGSPYILDTFLTDPAFIIELRGMNSTMQNYKGLIQSLKDDSYITQTTYIDFEERIDLVRSLSTELAEKSEGLYNLSDELWDSPDCVELIDYINEMDDCLGVAENFSASWLDFIDRDNNLVSSLEDVYVATINPSDAQIMKQSIASIRTGFEQYKVNSEDYVESVVENVESRAERKEAKDELDIAFTAVNGKTQEAVNKYNEAVTAFGKGDYQNTKKLAKEAILLAEDSGNTGSDPVIIVKDAPDYSIYFIIVAVMVGIILIITLLNRRKVDEFRG